MSRIEASREMTGRTSDEVGRPSSKVMRWAALILLFLLVGAFMFVLAPWIQRSEWVRPLADYIEETGIDAEALFYTEVEEAAEAEMNMRHTLIYLPEGHE